jgi:hypothetical protein
MLAAAGARPAAATSNAAALSEMSLRHQAPGQRISFTPE